MSSLQAGRLPPKSRPEATRDREAFELMYRENVESVRRYVLRRSARGDGQDVLAEIFAVAWQRFSQCPPQPLPWLYAIAFRVLANSRRQAERRRRLESSLTAEAYVHVQSSDEDAPQNAALARAFYSLPVGDRETLALVAWESLIPRDAALALGISQVAFRVRFHRAKRRLEQAIAVEESNTEARTEREVRLPWAENHLT